MKLIRTNEGKQWSPKGHTDVISTEITSATMTAGRAEIHISDMAPGAYSAVDVHYDSEQTFFLLSGVLTFTNGTDLIEAKAGDAIFVPSGDPHGISNQGAVAAVCLVVTSPPLA